ncbi:transmembrane protein 39A-B-like [Oscarella lobularis]|uniref:transmembrane protein 39A-B-like n=1 Tax=Oscarella lobularis TaxID=121494 RepID=UPI00331395D8
MPWGGKKPSTSKHPNGPHVARIGNDASAKLSSARNQANGSAKAVHRSENPKAEPNPIDLVLHQQFPRIPAENRIEIETFLLLFLLSATFAQNFSIYHTSVYLANHDLIFFTTVLFTRQFLATCFDQFPPYENLGQRVQWILYVAKCLLVAVAVVMAVWFILKVMRNDSIANSLMLLYPGFLYLSLFGFSTENDKTFNGANRIESSDEIWLIRTTLPYTWTGLSPPPSLRSSSSSTLTSNEEIRLYIHSFSIPSPTTNRREVDRLQSDVYSRLKRLLFRSIVCTYYASFLPMQFVQQDYLAFNKRWCYKLLVFVWVNTFSVLACESFPARFCVTLYKCAMYLGTWKGASFSKKASFSWNPEKIWPLGTLVDYEKNRFEAAGLQTTSEPGNLSHYHFYYAFSNLTIVPTFLLTLQSLSLIYQLVLLFYTTAWQHAVVLSVLLFFSCYSIYKTFRNWTALSQSAIKRF